MSNKSIFSDVVSMPEKDKEYLLKNLKNIGEAVSGIAQNGSISSNDRKILSFMQTYCDKTYFETILRKNNYGDKQPENDESIWSGCIPAISMLMNAIYSEDMSDNLRSKKDEESNRVLEIANIIKESSTECSSAIMQSFNNLMKNETVAINIICSTITVGILKPLLKTQILPLQLFSFIDMDVDDICIGFRCKQSEWKSVASPERELYSEEAPDWEVLKDEDINKSPNTRVRVAYLYSRSLVVSPTHDFDLIKKKYKALTDRGKFYISSNFESQLRFKIAYKILNRLQIFIYNYIYRTLSSDQAKDHSGYVQLTDFKKIKDKLDETSQKDFHVESKFSKFGDIERNQNRGKQLDEQELLKEPHKFVSKETVIPTVMDMGRVYNNFQLATGMQADTMLIPEKALRRIYCNSMPRNINDRNYSVSNVDSSFNSNINFERYEQAKKDVMRIAEKCNAINIYNICQKIPYATYEIDGIEINVIPFFENNTDDNKENINNKLFRWDLQEREKTSAGKIDKTEEFSSQWCIFEGGLINANRVFDRLYFNSKPSIKTNNNEYLSAAYFAKAMGGFVDDAVVGKFQAAAGRA